jgi:hypothetical protein
VHGDNPHAEEKNADGEGGIDNEKDISNSDSPDDGIRGIRRDGEDG